jgi:hypothetical protein
MHQYIICILSREQKHNINQNNKKVAKNNVNSQILLFISRPFGYTASPTSPVPLQVYCILPLIQKFNIISWYSVVNP